MSSPRLVLLGDVSKRKPPGASLASSAPTPSPQPPQPPQPQNYMGNFNVQEHSLQRQEASTPQHGGQHGLYSMPNPEQVAYEVREDERARMRESFQAELKQQMQQMQSQMQIQMQQEREKSQAEFQAQLNAQKRANVVAIANLKSQHAANAKGLMREAKMYKDAADLANSTIRANTADTFEGQMCPLWLIKSLRCLFQNKNPSLSAVR